MSRMSVESEASPARPIDRQRAANIQRRHLSVSQRSMIWGQLKDVLEAEARDRQGARTDLCPNLGEGSGRASERAADSLVVPDLLVARGGLKWVEVKYKARADFTHKTQRMETGISLRLWQHYIRVEAETRIHVWLMFVHERESEIVGNSVSQLRQVERVYPGRKMGRGGMVFFPCSGMKRIASLEQVRRELGGMGDGQ